ncbi:MAG: tRNA (adenosine(37)-N6)-dimethylallyltransferase MiaA [Immundisolibacteraceae bacterium]|nr:tRNA (adenosine(37)-N6)-dimethylallyltransferase MiaA [Immundisolibacteraceae bacterium]
MLKPRHGELPIVVVTGPTASGKSGLAMKLADRFPCRLISVDSSLVYRGMDVGTAKPDCQLLKQYPHELVNIREPDQTYSVGDFVTDATKVIAEARESGQVPVLVGGTLLYLRGLFQGLAELPKADPELRLQIELEAGRLGWAKLHQQLAEIDPQAAVAISVNDQQRIQRALEVYRITGKPISFWRQQSRPKVLDARVLKIILSPPLRETLHRQIAVRSQQMLTAGLIAEVEGLRDKVESSGQQKIDQLPAMRAVGYRQVLEYLRSEIAADNLVERITIATRQLAKRQLTWLRSEPSGIWLDSNSTNLLKRATCLVDEHLDCYG